MVINVNSLLQDIVFFVALLLYNKSMFVRLNFNVGKFINLLIVLIYVASPLAHEVEEVLSTIIKKKTLMSTVIWVLLPFQENIR